MNARMSLDAAISLGDPDAALLLYDVLDGQGVPAHLHDGLVRYLLQGTLPGSFLTAVLRNDLREAVLRADPASFAGLPALLVFLATYTPAGCHGSPAAVARYCDEASARFHRVRVSLVEKRLREAR